jgi:GNAT superfamily N-acetyltransferase
VGYLLGFDHPTFYANGRVAWVEELMVGEAWRRQRVGASLMRAFEDWARGRGCRLVALATRRAAAFYTATGYEESATFFRKLLLA